MVATGWGISIRFSIHVPRNVKRVGIVYLPKGPSGGMRYWSVRVLLSITCSMVCIGGALDLMFLNSVLVTWIIVENWYIMKTPQNPTACPLMSSSILPTALKKSVIRWTIWTLVDFLFIVMKSIKLVIGWSWCLAWFADRSLNITSIAVIQLAIPSGVFSAASLIA